MSNPIDTKVISKLAEILDKSNLTELEYEDEGCRISLSQKRRCSCSDFCSGSDACCSRSDSGSGRSASGTCRRQRSRRSG